MKRLLPAPLAYLLIVSTGWAEERDAFSQIATAKLFAFGGVGFAGTTTEGELAFRKIFASNTAEADFLRLLEQANPQGRSYALVGLRLKNLERFRERVKPFLRSRTTVETAAGCIPRTMTEAELAADINAGRYDDSARREIPKLPQPVRK